MAPVVDVILKIRKIIIQIGRIVLPRRNDDRK